MGNYLFWPMMLNIFKFKAKMATATSLCMIMFTSLSSGLTHFFEGHVDKELLMYTVPGFLLGSIVGNYLSLKTSDKLLKKIIASSILLAALTTLIHYFS